MLLPSFLPNIHSVTVPAFLFLLLLAGCAANHTVIHTDQNWTAFRRGVPINKMVVLPIEPEGRSKEQQQAVELLTTLLFGSFSDVPRDAVDKALAQTKQGPLDEKALSLGKLVGAHAVVYGKLDRFEQRSANGTGVQRPASVAFHLHVVDVNSGDLMWWARYDETQQAPRGDRLFMAPLFVRNPRWLTAEELASQAVEWLKQDFDRAFRIALNWWGNDGNGP